MLVTLQWYNNKKVLHAKYIEAISKSFLSIIPLSLYQQFQSMFTHPVVLLLDIYVAG